MSLLDDFNQEFIKRHDFYSEDLDLLFNKWQPKTLFKNIPEAWILPIDTMLSELNKENFFPKEVEQIFGQLYVNFGSIIDTFTTDQEFTYKAIIKHTVEQIKLIDEDLYLYFDIDPESMFLDLKNEHAPTFH